VAPAGCPALTRAEQQADLHRLLVIDVELEDQLRSGAQAQSATDRTSNLLARAHKRLLQRSGRVAAAQRHECGQLWTTDARLAKQYPGFARNVLA
jgi:hypothetical protein